MHKPRTLGELEATGWRSRSVYSELRANLIAKLRAGEEVFPGIVGFGETVVPQIQNAILSGHSFILLGLRGQAKTRLARSLTSLLDEWIPAIEGSELNEDPRHPVTVPSVARARELGADLPVRWIHRNERYHEKLATPDVTVADLIGDVDPIKAATQRLTFADPEVIHFGILPRSNRGIFTVNELPDLQARIQVALLNILEEGDIQVRGFPIRMPLDVCLVFTANPEDYTNRGNIITPLRDRIASQILTHYPRDLEQAMAITDQESWAVRDDDESPVAVTVPRPLREAIDLVAFEARASEFVDQASGVSARLSIALYENAISNAERRAHLAGDSTATVRPADLFTGLSAVTGKLELVYDGEREGIATVARALVGKALFRAFLDHFPDAYAEDQAGGGHAVYGPALEWFSSGGSLKLDDHESDAAHLEHLREVTGLEHIVREHADPHSDGECAALMELVLEGLHQGSLLSRDDENETRIYGDMLAQMARSLGGA